MGLSDRRVFLPLSSYTFSYDIEKAMLSVFCSSGCSKSTFSSRLNFVLIDCSSGWKAFTLTPAMETWHLSGNRIMYFVLESSFMQRTWTRPFPSAKSFRSFSSIFPL